MSDASVIFTNEVHRKLSTLGTWLPGQRLRLGEIVTFEKRTIQRADRLSRVGIDVEEEVGDVIAAAIGFASSAVTATNGEGGAGAGAPGGPGAKLLTRLLFERRGAVFFRAERIRHDRIGNWEEVRSAIIQKARDGEWRREWRVVTEVSVAERSLIMLSRSANATADLAVEAGAVPLAQELAEGRAGVQYRHSNGMDEKFVIPGESTPLFRAQHVVRRPSGRKTKVTGPRGRLRPDFRDPPPGQTPGRGAQGKEAHFCREDLLDLAPYEWPEEE